MTSVCSNEFVRMVDKMRREVYMRPISIYGRGGACCMVDTAQMVSLTTALKLYM
jgi:hypothetical protein